MRTEVPSNLARIQAALEGRPPDRPPWSLWRHFYDRETTAEGLAQAMLEWRRRYGFDFLKVNPRAHYHVEGWGVEYVYSGSPHERPQLRRSAVQSAADWGRIEPLDLNAGALAEQLDALGLVRQALGDQLPFVQTIFSPLMVAGYLADSEEQLQRDLREHLQAVHRALEAIAETFARFGAACLAAGAAGIFFATTWATHQKLTSEQYAAFGRPYDLRVLSAVQGAGLNILHVCGEQTMLLDLADYPVHAFSWAATTPGNPSLAEARSKLPGALIGGLSHAALTAEDPSVAEREARAALAQTGGQGWVLGPACSIPTTAREANIRAAGAAVGASFS